MLTTAVLTALAERLRTPPEDGGRWTGAKAAIWRAARLGLAKVHPQRGWEALKRVRWSIQALRPRHPRSPTPEQQTEFRGPGAVVARARAAHPGLSVEVSEIASDLRGAGDEHRLGLKPIRRRV